MVPHPWSIVEFEVDQSSKYFGVDCGAQVGNIILLFLSFSFRIDRKLAAGIRCTVKIDPAMYGKPGVIKGSVVSPAAPREDNGMYWGYTTRFANSIHEVFDGCPFDGGYDLKIGTSERGDKSVEQNSFRLPTYEHTLIVFGGVAGIEECVDADESIKLPGSQSKKLFDMW